MPIDENLRHLQVEYKEDSPTKLAAIMGKLTKFFLFATEFELLRTFVNQLRDDIDTLHPYGVYIALISQNGTNNPTAIILENTIGNIVWTREDMGFYKGTLAGAFVLEKSMFFVGTAQNGSPVHVSLYQGNENEVWLIVTDNDGLGIDDALLRMSIEIRVYPSDE